jgi:hypothetical protein
VLTHDEIAQLLTLQSQAYDLLMWLADDAIRDPYLLSPEAISAVKEPEPAAQWLNRHRDHLPQKMLPERMEGAFANLFSSFFATSFHVDHLEFEGRLLDSRVKVGVHEKSWTGFGLEQTQALALRHLASSEKIQITEKDARKLVRRKSLHEPSLLWTYIWEMDRRAKQKGKGPVVHRIWRSIPFDTRKSLNLEQIWHARAQLLDAVRDYLAAKASEPEN